MEVDAVAVVPCTAAAARQLAAGGKLYAIRESRNVIRYYSIT